MMANNQSTFIQLPMDVLDPMELRRFLDKLVQQLDVVFGNRGVEADGGTTISLEAIKSLLNNIDSRLSSLESIDCANRIAYLEAIHTPYEATYEYDTANNKILEVRRYDSGYLFVEVYTYEDGKLVSSKGQFVAPQELSTSLNYSQARNSMYIGMI